MSANARHDQNTITKKVNMEFPSLSFNVSRIYPFKRKEAIGNKWYDKIGVSLTSNLSNRISTYDSLLFTDKTLKEMQNGIIHSMPVSTSIPVLKYLTLSPSIGISSKWYFKTINKHYDTVANRVVTDTVPGFKMAEEFNTALSLTTKLYGMYQFRNSKIKAIRHVITPNISLSYRPDFSQSKYGYYRSVQTNSLALTEKYSIFQNGIYGSPGSGKSGIVSFGINNNLEMKVKTKTDTSEGDKKISLLDYLNIASSYNMAIKHYKWSAIGVNAGTTLFKKINIVANTSFDPYAIDVFGKHAEFINTSGEHTEQFEWNVNHRLGRLTSANLSAGTSIRSKQKKKQNETTRGTDTEMDYIKKHPGEFIDFNVPWSLNVSYSYNYSKPFLVKTENQTFNFSGDFSLTPNWKIGFNSGYDFKNHKLSYTSVNIYRDLHCWEMVFNWTPFGLRQSYSIDVKVKASVLQDLKLSKKRDWFDFQ